MKLDKYLADNLPKKPTLEQAKTVATEWALNWPPTPLIETYNKDGAVRVRVKFCDHVIYADAVPKPLNGCG